MHRSGTNWCKVYECPHRTFRCFFYGKKGIIFSGAITPSSPRVHMQGWIFLNQPGRSLSWQLP
ncbi:unnamed protein product [Heterosigma akashiwo]